MKTKILFFIASFFMISAVSAQSSAEVGGEALAKLAQYQNGKYSEYVKEYKRMCEKFSSDPTFADFLTDGNTYTVLVPDNGTVDEFRAEIKKNDPKLRNSIKYTFIKGSVDKAELADGQSLKSLLKYKGSQYNVSAKKRKVSVTDMQGNKITLNQSFSVGNITFYPVNFFPRY